MAEKQEFTRKLKSRHIQLMALGGTIGTGLFTLPFIYGCDS